MVTFKKQFDKLTEAYIKNQVNPFMDCNCFVGNLLNQDDNWAIGREWKNLTEHHLTQKAIQTSYYSFDVCVIKSIEDNAEGFYTPDEILELERMFLLTFKKNGGSKNYSPWKSSLKDEEALFRAFEKTLDLLKEIHISKGENVEEFEFTKRALSI